jgi:hypothetical protein
LIGRGTWTLVQDGAFVDVTYDWRVRAQKPLLRSMSFGMRPLFAANHRWAMRQGEESLGLELRRRRAATAAMRATIPPPPGPITYAGVTLLAGALLAGGTFAYVLGRLAQKAKKSRDGRL